MFKRSIFLSSVLLCVLLPMISHAETLGTRGQPKITTVSRQEFFVQHGTTAAMHVYVEDGAVKADLWKPKKGMSGEIEIFETAYKSDTNYDGQVDYSDQIEISGQALANDDQTILLVTNHTQQAIVTYTNSKGLQLRDTLGGEEIDLMLGNGELTQTAVLVTCLYDRPSYEGDDDFAAPDDDSNASYAAIWKRTTDEMSAQTQLWEEPALCDEDAQLTIRDSAAMANNTVLIIAGTTDTQWQAEAFDITNNFASLGRVELPLTEGASVEQHLIGLGEGTVHVLMTAKNDDTTVTRFYTFDDDAGLWLDPIVLRDMTIEHVFQPYYDGGNRNFDPENVYQHVLLSETTSDRERFHFFQWDPNLSWRTSAEVQTESAADVIAPTASRYKKHLSMAFMTRDTDVVDLYQWTKNEGWQKEGSTSMTCENCRIDLRISSDGKHFFTWLQDNTLRTRIWFAGNDTWSKAHTYETIDKWPEFIRLTQHKGLIVISTYKEMEQWVPNQGWSGATTLDAAVEHIFRYQNTLFAVAYDNDTDTTTIDRITKSGMQEEYTRSGRIGTAFKVGKYVYFYGGVDTVVNLAGL